MAKAIWVILGVGMTMGLAAMAYWAVSVWVGVMGG